jgi:hypothetical protein
VGPVTILAEALANGARVELGPPHRLWIGKSYRERLEPDRETVREILRRAVVFREQAAGFILDGRPLPILALPGCQEGDGCISCGTALEGRRFRCEVCTLAVKLALEERP